MTGCTTYRSSYCSTSGSGMALWLIGRWLLNGKVCAAAGQRERNVQIGKRLDELEKELRSGLSELRTALDSGLIELTPLLHTHFPIDTINLATLGRSI